MNHNGQNQHPQDGFISGQQIDVFEPLLDSEEAAALLKIHPKTLQKLARNGEIEALHIGKLWRFRASALNRWLEKLSG
jgi:excisionase family DNA binding protein